MHIYNNNVNILTNESKATLISVVDNSAEQYSGSYAIIVITTRLYKVNTVDKNMKISSIFLKQIEKFWYCDESAGPIWDYIQLYQ